MKTAEQAGKKKNFNIEYRKVKRAEAIEKVIDCTKVQIVWNNSDTNVYTTLLSMFNAYGVFTVSYDYLAGECNLSSKTIGRCLKKMNEFGIITIEQTGKRVNGCFSPNKFTYVVDLEQSLKFRCIINKNKKAYDKKKKDRQKRLEYLQGVIVSSGWIGAQCSNYWKNTNYELITGEYLQGDKTSKLLYKHGKSFSPSDDLKTYEIKTLTEGL